MSSIYGTFKIDAKVAYDKGILLDFGEFKIRILRADKKNKKYNLAMTRYQKKYSRMIKKDILSNDKAEEILTNSYAEGIVIDWEGVKDEDGKDIPFSKEACLKLFQDLPELYRMIVEEAESIQNFQGEKKEAKKK